LYGIPQVAKVASSPGTFPRWLPTESPRKKRFSPDRFSSAGFGMPPAQLFSASDGIPHPGGLLMISTRTPAPIPLTLCGTETGKTLDGSGKTSTRPATTLERQRSAAEIRQMLRDIAWVLHWTQRVKRELAAECMPCTSEAIPADKDGMPADLPA
jgi:hypothetical protein